VLLELHPHFGKGRLGVLHVEERVGDDDAPQTGHDLLELRLAVRGLGLGGRVLVVPLQQALGLAERVARHRVELGRLIQPEKEINKIKHTIIYCEFDVPNAVDKLLVGHEGRPRDGRKGLEAVRKVDLLAAKFGVLEIEQLVEMQGQHQLIEIILAAASRGGGLLG